MDEKQTQDVLIQLTKIEFRLNVLEEAARDRRDTKSKEIGMVKGTAIAVAFSLLLRALEYIWTHLKH